MNQKIKKSLSILALGMFVLAACQPAASTSPAAAPTTMSVATQASAPAQPAAATMPPAVVPTVAPTTVPVTGASQPTASDGYGADNTYGAAPKATQASAASTDGTMVNTSQNASLGTFLVDSKGMTLYLYTKDSPGGKSVCSGKCLVNWPALLTTGAPVAGSGVDSKKLGTIKRDDGSTQITYNNMPLYYYIKDKQPGDTTGQNVGQVWFVVAP